MLPMYMIVRWICSFSIPWKRILSNWDPQISYSVITIISKRVLDILHDVCIASWQSQPHIHKNNPTKRRHDTVKNNANQIMDQAGSFRRTWYYP